MLADASLGMGGETDVGFEGMVEVEGAEEVAMVVFGGGCGGLRFRFDGGGGGGVAIVDATIGCCFGRGAATLFVVSPLSFLRLST